MGSLPYSDVSDFTEEVNQVPVEMLGQIPQMEREAEQLEERADALRQLVAALRRVYADSVAVSSNGNGTGHTGDGPRGREAVLQIMSDRPMGMWSIKSIVRENRARKWPSSDKAIENAVHRLHNDGRLGKVRPGVYRVQEKEVLAA